MRFFLYIVFLIVVHSASAQPSTELPAAVQTLANSALSKMEAKNFEGAEKDLSSAIAIKPVKGLFNARGMARLNLKRFQLAIDDFNKSLSYDSTDVLVYERIGLCYALLYQIPTSKSYFAITLKGDPKNETANLYMGIFSYREEQPELAAKYFSTTIQHHPSSMDAYSRRARCYYDLKKYDAAIEDYKIILAKNPNDANAYYHMGSSYMELDKYIDAIKYLTQSLRINPNNADAYCNRGTCYSYAKNYENAIKDFNAALLLDPKHQLAADNKKTCEENLLKRTQ